MPKARKIARQDILKAAADIVKRGGTLSVRAISEELGCSTQPVYSCFKGIGELKAALYEEAKAQYHAAIEAAMAASPHGRYAAYGIGFVRFAREKKGLFRFLFIDEERGFPADPFFDEILAEMMQLYRMDEATARAFHADMTVFSYGLALTVGNVPLTDAEIAAAFDREFYALYGYYFPQRPRFWEKRGA